LELVAAVRPAQHDSEKPRRYASMKTNVLETQY